MTDAAFMASKVLRFVPVFNDLSISSGKVEMIFVFIECCLINFESFILSLWGTSFESLMLLDLNNFSFGFSASTPAKIIGPINGPLPASSTPNINMVKIVNW